MDIMRELKRVLKKTGVIFWNHADSYGGSGGASGKYPEAHPEGNVGGRFGIDKRKISIFPSKPPTLHLTPKCMLLQNYRFIIRCIDELGLILRNIIIWHKPNHMPSSVKDRFTNAYEPIFMLVKSKKYWFDLDAVRLPHKTGKGVKFNMRVRDAKRGYKSKIGVKATPFEIEQYHGEEINYHSLGKNPGDVWTIPTQPFPEAHFATFPKKLVEPMIKAGCPQWICKKCGKARERITKTEYTKQIRGIDKTYIERERKGYRDVRVLNRQGKKGMRYYTIGWTDCGCNAGWVSGVVLDPFMGAGTTALVAEKLNRRWIGIELNPFYIEIAKKRIEVEARQMKLDL